MPVVWKFLFCPVVATAAVATDYPMRRGAESVFKCRPFPTPRNMATPYLATLLGVVFGVTVLFVMLMTYLLRRACSQSQPDTLSAAPHSVAAAVVEMATISSTIPSEDVISATLESFPVCEGEEGIECSVCLEVFAAGESIRSLPKCGHIYHFHCIVSWLMVGGRVCPYCKSEY
ncbi:43kDa postsynaptic protein [Trema orientale]|uniref:43kDa postsynaptic protein n=1 Tax=Trema orientale TaxID=63057 RepID=A0A2P5FU12_TREOI|nr:43kDa postsynaptic protein [Trema orientale]